ncbi:hypothetical protein ACFLYQ_00985 [Chloroflexota bacterium]
MRELKELAFAISRIILGMVILIGGLVALDIFVYLSFTGSTFSDEIAYAFSDGYDHAYDRTFNIGYEMGYSEAYNKGYEKGYEIGQGHILEDKVGSLVELRNPTHTELRQFLSADNTNLNTFISGKYVCYDFVAEMNNNAEVAGIRAAYVRIRSANWAHALVAFETVDRGLVFIEPQSDKEVILEIGKPYPWWQVGAASPLRSQAPLTEIQIIW